jgi:hypothetical protein
MSSTTPKSPRSKVRDGKVEYDNANKCTPNIAPVSCNEKRRQPWKELVEQINQQTEATEGDSNEKLERRPPSGLLAKKGIITATLPSATRVSDKLCIMHE